MTKTPRELPVTKPEIENYLNAKAREVALAARLETADRARDRGRRLAAEFHQLHSEASQELGEEHEVTLGAEKGLIQEEFRQYGAARTAKRLADLADRCSHLLGEDHKTTRQAFAIAAKFSRFAGNTAWRGEYERLIKEAEEKHGVESRRASIKRSNFSVALNEWGQPDDDREEAYRIAWREWLWRRKTFGESDSFPYVAAANVLSAALRSLQHGRALMDPNQLQRFAAEVYEQRLRLLGSDHENTQNSFVTLHSIRAERGAEDARWLLLSVAGIEHEGLVTPSQPERLPIALSRAFALAEDVGTAREWMTTSREAMEKNYGADAPRTIGAIVFLERSILVAEGK